MTLPIDEYQRGGAGVGEEAGGPGGMTAVKSPDLARVLSHKYVQ